MKRVIVLLIVLIGSTVVGNAQYFVEWSMGASYQGGEESNGGASTVSPSYLTIEVMPRVGYWLSDGVAVGASPFFIWSNQKFQESPNMEKTEMTLQIWGLSVFGRYRLFGTEKLSILCVSEIDNGRGSLNKKTESFASINYSTSYIRFNLYPAVSYCLSGKLSIIARWEFLDLRFHSETIKDKIAGGKKTTNSFGFKTRSDIFGSISEISLGFTYNF